MQFFLRLTPLTITAAAVLTSVASYAQQPIRRVSESSAGIQAERASEACAVSADGSAISFTSYAENLTSGRGWFGRDVFVRDLASGGTEFVSVALNGAPPDGDSLYSKLSADGRFVVFSSVATNLVASDTNGAADVFCFDRLTRSTERVSLRNGGGQANGASWFGSPSADGRFILFESDASNLVPNDTNSHRDLFLRDRISGTTERVNLAHNGGQANGWTSGADMTPDGRFVVFGSYATNLVAGASGAQREIYLRDRLLGTTELISRAIHGGPTGAGNYEPCITPDGRYVAFESWAPDLVPGDTNQVWDIFLLDRRNGLMLRVSVASTGTQGDDESRNPSLAASGERVAFSSEATNLVLGDTNGHADVFWHDLRTGLTERVSVDPLGGNADHHSANPKLSASGSFIAFDSYAHNLIRFDTNDSTDVFARGLPAAFPSRNAFLLVADLDWSAGAPATLQWFGTPPRASVWLFAAASDAGALAAGHPMDLGPGWRVFARHTSTSLGYGRFTIPTIPQRLTGKNVFVEALASSATGGILDSNSLERVIR